MASAFSRLPLELLLEILQDMPDLPSLYRFICTSTKVNKAFEYDAVRILEKTIDRSIPHFKHLARIIAIMGSFQIGIGTDMRPSSDVNLYSIIAKLHSLQSNALTTAARSFDFAVNTPGPRYLLLTAYRIEHLSHMCFVSFLQNIHELVFRESEPTSKSKSFRPGVYFSPTAWWSPSWVERFRVERALWKLFIYWNLRAITRVDDMISLHYSEAIESIPDLGPVKEFLHRDTEKFHIFPAPVPEPRPDSKAHEVEEMSCISTALHELLGWRPLLFFSMLSSQARKLFIGKASSKMSPVLTETLHWKFENPKLSSFKGIQPSSVDNFNSKTRKLYWLAWENRAREDRFEFGDDGCWFPDHLGLCLWDKKRLTYLGLEHEFQEILLPAKRSGYFMTAHRIFRWQDIFLEELLRLPGGRKRPLSGKLKKQILRWHHAASTWGQSTDRRLGIGKRMSQLLAMPEEAD